MWWSYFFAQLKTQKLVYFFVRQQCPRFCWSKFNLKALSFNAPFPIYIDMHDLNFTSQYSNIYITRFRQRTKGFLWLVQADKWIKKTLTTYSRWGWQSKYFIAKNAHISILFLGPKRHSRWPHRWADWDAVTHDLKPIMWLAGILTISILLHRSTSDF